MRVNRHHPRILLPRKTNKCRLKRPASKKLQDRLPTSSVATVFFSVEMCWKKHISPKRGENGDLQRVGSINHHHLQQLHVLKLYLQIIHGNRREPPPNGLLKGQWWWKIVPQKRPAISWGFTWQFGGWLGPLDCHGFFGISPNISRKARLSASCAMPRKPTVFRTWSWRGLKFNTGASPPQ